MCTPPHAVHPPAYSVDEDDWLDYARNCVLQADRAKVRQGVAVYAFEGETEVDLSIDGGEELSLFDGSEVPVGWRIVEKFDDSSGRPRRRRGLVPASFVALIEQQQQEEPVSEESAATRLQARQRGRRARKFTRHKVNGVLPAVVYGLD